MMIHCHSNLVIHEEDIPLRQIIPPCTRPIGELLRPRDGIPSLTDLNPTDVAKCVPVGPISISYPICTESAFL